MRITVTALVLAALAALYGGWLIGRWALGLVLITVAGGVAAWALLHDDGRPAPQVHQVPGTVQDVLERARRAS